MTRSDTGMQHGGSRSAPSVLLCLSKDAFFLNEQSTALIPRSSGLPCGLREGLQIIIARILIRVYNVVDF